MQTTLTQIFIVLESVSHEKLGNQTFFQPKNRWSQKKKKRSSPTLRLIFRPKSEIQSFFSPKTSGLQKKRSSPKLRLIFGQNRKFKCFFTPHHEIYFTTSAPKFLWGGLFSIFHQKSASKAPKTCDFVYFTSQWGG